MSLAGWSAVGAGVLHTLAVGQHGEHPQLARIFAGVALVQFATGLCVLVRGGRLWASVCGLVNLAAIVGWASTRVGTISWIDGLATTESPGLLDTTCAALGLLAAAGATWALLAGRASESTTRIGVPAGAVAGVTALVLVVGAGTTPSHTEAGTRGAEHSHAVGADSGSAFNGATTTVPDDEMVEESTDPERTDESENDPGADDAAAWPRPYDPALPLDISGVDGVSAEQEQRARDLIARAQADLPRFADVNAVGALGFQSIGDARTGYEHYINFSYIGDDAFLDPTRPESLVYRVDGEARTLVSAMFMARPGMSMTDPLLTGYAGPLMQWHVHANLCWSTATGTPTVVGTVDADGNCPEGTMQIGGDIAMVHVWIVPHECGPFAALEGEGAGQADPNATVRTDQCASHDHHGGTDHADSEGTEPTGSAGTQPTGSAATEPTDMVDMDMEDMDMPVPYDPTKPIDLSGMADVTPEQQAFAENLVAINVIRLPQWADPVTAEAAGFHSIGDGVTGYEHYVQWAWINDDVWLDPDQPESLVYRVEPDGSRTLVSAMFMLPETMTLDQVPDWGGALMQWHIHDNLCFTNDPVAPRVGGLTNADGSCTPPLVKLGVAPMIHVWITPHPCGPFASLEGVGAGQIATGEERLCDSAHGSH